MRREGVKKEGETNTEPNTTQIRCNPDHDIKIGYFWHFLVILFLIFS